MYDISTKLMSIWYLHKTNEHVNSLKYWWVYDISTKPKSMSIKLMSIWYLYNIKVHVAYLQRFRICDISTIWENTSMLQGLKLRNEKLCEIFDTLVANRLYNEPFQVF